MAILNVTCSTKRIFDSFEQSQSISIMNIRHGKTLAHVGGPHTTPQLNSSTETMLTNMLIQERRRPDDFHFRSNFRYSFQYSSLSSWNRSLHSASINVNVTETHCSSIILPHGASLLTRTTRANLATLPTQAAKIHPAPHDKTLGNRTVRETVIRRSAINFCRLSLRDAATLAPSSRGSNAVHAKVCKMEFTTPFSPACCCPYR
jgi:hypothetical protein